MEFFRTIPYVSSENELQSIITFENIEKFSSQLFPLGESNGPNILVGSLWGEFTLHRTKINGGLRFALIECPNALCWTITTGHQPIPEHVVLHLTINRTNKSQEFLEEIKSFLDDHQGKLMECFEVIEQD